MKLLTDAIAFTTEPENGPSSFRPLSKIRLIILVGLTGVGKSTMVEFLQNELEFTLLPNRREITDEIMISTLQQEDGIKPYAVTDRVKRFEYTARYRAKFPGGMAHALSRLVINPKRVSPMLVFDGLRGLNEVQHAVTYFPRTRFIVLEAPDMVRLNRLLKRADAFDSAKIRASLANRNLIAGLQSIPGIEAVFSKDQLRQIARVTRAAGHSGDEVVKKLSIVVEERRNYDSGTARLFLGRKLPPKQVLVVDTAIQSPQVVAKQVGEWLGNNRRK